MYIVGIDIGGTFTDVVALEATTGRRMTAKSLSTPQDLTVGVMNGLEAVAKDMGFSRSELLAQTIKLSHATTQTSNAIFTFSGAKVGLLTTRGFEDQLIIMRGIGRVAGRSLGERRHPRATDKPPLLVDETRIRGVKERMDWQGDVVTPLDEDDARRAIRDLVETEKVEAIAISLLWSFANAGHEKRLAEIVREVARDIYVSVSSDVAPIRGEYERTATTVLNAYVGPTLDQYLSQLSDKLRDEKLQRPMLVVQANGGVSHVRSIMPVQTIESGPAVGVAAVRMLADSIDLKDVIATDVGGTTFKVSVLTEGKWATTKETVIQQYGLHLPMVDVESIGAGGGSIAWVDDVRLRVGPRSAGSDPGPVSYGRGGTEPTVTDADLILGYLNKDNFWGGRLRLDLDSAGEVIQKRIANPLFGGDLTQAAVGIRRVIDHQMGDLIRKTTVERGFNPENFVLFAYGGMGPAHCNAYARAAGASKVVVPVAASVLSALGAAQSDILHSLIVSDILLLPTDPANLMRHYRRMEAQGDALLEAEGVPLDQRVFSRWVEMRYRRQMHEVRVEVPSGEIDEKTLAQISADFERKYEQLYGEGAAYREAGIEMVTLGVDVRGKLDLPVDATLPAADGDASEALRGRRRMYCTAGQRWETRPVFHGLDLRPGHVLTGLCVVEYPQTTVVVEQGTQATVDSFGNIILELGDSYQ